jgi:hypothetical protein
VQLLSQKLNKCCIKTFCFSCLNDNCHSICSATATSAYTTTHFGKPTLEASICIPSGWSPDKRYVYYARMCPGA